MRKISGQIYSRDVSPSTPTVRINSTVPKHSRTTTYPYQQSFSQQYQSSIQTSKNNEKVYFTLGGQGQKSDKNQFSQTYNQQDIDRLATNKYINFIPINDTILSSQQNYSFEDTLCGDSLAKYENPINRNNQIVRKLGYMNNIFKELGILKKEGFDKKQLKQLEMVESQLIELERNILRI